MGQYSGPLSPSPISFKSLRHSGQESKYGLGYTLSANQEREAIDLALELAQREDLHEEWQTKRSRLLEDKIDVTAWMVDFVEAQVKTP